MSRRRRRRKQHEEHANHEAWAIPYGDLITLLLAFFVVMYAISSVNDGKYRVLSDSLVAAFQGTPRTLEPVQVGEKRVGTGADIHMTIVDQVALEGQPKSLPVPFKIRNDDKPVAPTEDPAAAKAREERARALAKVAAEVESSMSELIGKDMLSVKRHDRWVEVAIRTDLLFSSGKAALSPSATEVLQKLADSLAPFPNAIRVEGHTDDRPIRTAQYPSNWELSAARAASVVRLFVERGIDPARLAALGLAEFRPVMPNDSAEGRNANRRVLLAIQDEGSSAEGEYSKSRGEAALPAGSPDVGVPPPAPVEVSPPEPAPQPTKTASVN